MALSLRISGALLLLVSFILQLVTGTLEDRRFLAGKRAYPSRIETVSDLVTVVNYANSKASATVQTTVIAVTLVANLNFVKPLPDLVFLAGVSITGNCKTKTGQPTQCIIDGQGKSSIFGGSFDCTIVLSNIIVQNSLNGVHSGNCDFTAVNCTFKNCVSKNCGGVISVGLTTNNVLITSSTFINNVGQGGGGAICAGMDVAGGPVVKIANSIFIGNVAVTGGGGAILTRNSPLYVTNSVFKSNLASSGDGGAIQMTPGNYPQNLDQAINSTFVNNTAVKGNGGGIAVVDYGSVLLCRNTFTANKAPKSVKSADVFLSYLPFDNGVFTTCGQTGAKIYAPSTPGSGQSARSDSSPSWTITTNCSGCTGCFGDCNGNGQCGLDQLLDPVCTCKDQFDATTSCTACRTGFSLANKCTTCLGGFLPSNISSARGKTEPTVCTPCLGLREVSDIPDPTTALASSAVASYAACQKFCSSQSLCNYWVYFEKNAPQAGCRGNCLVYWDSLLCFPTQVLRNATYRIEYQSTANDPSNCH